MTIQASDDSIDERVIDTYLLDTVTSIMNKLEILEYLAGHAELPWTYPTLIEESFYQLQSLVDMYCTVEGVDADSTDNPLCY